VDQELLEEINFDDRVTGRVVITGYVIGEDTSRDRPLPGAPDPGEPRTQWMETRVVRLREATPHGSVYVLLREAYSLLYHLAGTDCQTVSGDRRGVVMTVGMMDGELEKMGFELEDAVACPECRPADVLDLDDGDRVRFEVPRRSMDQCASAQQVVTTMISRRSAGGVRRTSMPQWAAELFAQCAANDPGWMSGEQQVTRIG
jgi:hypothetical protein